MAVLSCLLAGQVAARSPEADCLECHAPAAARAEVPLIEGQHPDYLLAQLTRFRDRHRESFPMSALTAGFSDEDARRLVETLSRRAWAGVPGPADAEAVARGRLRAAALGCIDCHGADFRGGGVIPRLAGQREAYVERQIRGFGIGERHHPPVGSGARMYELAEGDAADLAAFIAGIDGSR